MRVDDDRPAMDLKRALPEPLVLVCATVGTTVDTTNRRVKPLQSFRGRMNSPFVVAYEALSSIDMSILIAEDNMAQRHYLREILEKEFPSHVPVSKPATAKRP